MQPYQSLCIKKNPTKPIQESINIQSIPSFKEGDLLISIQDFNFRRSKKLTSFQDKLSFCFNYIINFLPFAPVTTETIVSKSQTQYDNNELVKSYLLPFLNAIHQIIPFNNVIIESMDNLNIAYYDNNLKQIVLTDIQKLLDKVKRSQLSEKHIGYDYDDEEDDDELITLLHPVFCKLLNGDLDTIQRLLFLDESVVIINDYYSYFEDNYKSDITGFNPSVTKEKFSILFDMLSQNSQVKFNQEPLWKLIGDQHLLDLYVLTDSSYFNPKRNKENLDYLLESISSIIVIDLMAKNKIDFHQPIHNNHIQKTLVQLAKDMFGEDAVSQNVIDFVMNQTSKSETWIDNQQVNKDMDKFKNHHSIPRLSDIHCIEFLDYFDKKLIEKVNKQKLLAEKNKNLPLYKYHSDLDKQLALLDIENTVSLTKEQRDLPIVQTWFEQAMLIKNQFDMTVIFDFLIWDKMKSMKHPVDLKAWLDEFEYELYLS